MMNFEEWEYSASNLPADIYEKEDLLDDLSVKFLEDLTKSEVVQNWLEQFDEKYRNRFLKDYASHKVKIVRYNTVYIQTAESVTELKFRKVTHEVLGMILQKKLYNLQLQWRAELIELPGIQISSDFLFWGGNILNCPFIEPITSTELEIMLRYIQSDNFEAEHASGILLTWQFYDVISKQDEDDEDEILSWYRYYDTYMGTGGLQLLPNIRGDKEDKYRKASIEKQRAEIEKLQASTGQQAVPKPMQKQRLHSSLKNFYELARIYDDPYFVCLMKADLEERTKENELDEKECDADTYMIMLRDIPDLPPVRGGLSWRKALQQCYEDYLKIFLTGDLPVLCEEYHLYRSMGFSYDVQYNRASTLEAHRSSDWITNQILDGRELLGEPRDFNF